MSLIKENLDDHNILLKYVDILITQKDYKEAIKLLKDGIKTVFNNYRGIVIKLSNKLISIYKEQNMNEEYKFELYEMFFNYDEYDLDIFKEIKGLYNNKEWSVEFANILNRIDEKDKKNIYSKVMNIYIEENMIDEIFALLKNCYDFNTIKRYEESLTRKYKDEIFYLYTIAIKNEARRTSSRCHYRKLGSKLNYLKSKSKEKADILINELTIEYKNRPAMIDEFQKINIC